MPATPVRLVVPLLLALAPGAASAKPRPEGEGRSTVRQRAERDSSSTPDSAHSIGVAFVADGALHGAAGSYGVAAEYRVRFTDLWGALAGAELRFREHDTLIEPFVAGEATLVETRHLAFSGSGGVAVPVTLEPDITHVALAMRAAATARWLWPLTDIVTPYAEAVALFGPVLTAESPHDVHAAIQLWVGATLNL